jgi:hypothetical protein
MSVEGLLTDPTPGHQYLPLHCAILGWLHPWGSPETIFQMLPAWAFHDDPILCVSTYDRAFQTPSLHSETSPSVQW